MTPYFIAHIIHILESIENIRIFLKDCPDAEFLENDKKTYSAILYSLQTLAESAHKLPDDIKKTHSQVKWADYRDFRNTIAHDYLGNLYPERILEFIEDYLPIMEQAMLEHIPNWKELRDKNK